jgi:periplasmic protein TonB
MQAADDTTVTLTERLVPPLDTGQRGFRVALFVACLCHAAFLIQVGQSNPRSIGDRTGQPDAIAVELVSAADLDSKEIVAVPPAGAPPKSAAPPPPEPAPQPDAATPAPAAPPAETQPKEPPPKTEPKPEKEPKTAALPDFTATLPDLATVPLPMDPAKTSKPEDAEPSETEPAKPTEKQSAPAPAAKPPAPQVRLNPSDAAPPGRSAGATRPPGITQSGENDEFGRGVIRALRSTMPPPQGIFGQVTVRLILTENGDLAEVRVLQPSGRSGLDQSVVFATKQTYFPLPPYKSTLADRTFTIRYVYR